MAHDVPLRVALNQVTLIGTAMVLKVLCPGDILALTRSDFNTLFLFIKDIFLLKYNVIRKIFLTLNNKIRYFFNVIKCEKYSINPNCQYIRHS